MELMREREGSSEEIWIKHYSSKHNILLVGDGDFSFSLCLARAFGSATNIVATSLDSYGELMKKYKYARANLASLKGLGASVLHGVDATKMKKKIVPHIEGKKFHRIIYNFPHAGFHNKEDHPDLIRMHRNLVRGFLTSSSSLLCVDGEIHVNHKITSPFNTWRIEDLASECSLLFIGQDTFRIEDYPSYRNKRGSGSRSDEAFPLGECCTFKFKLYPGSLNIAKTRSNKLSLMHIPDLGNSVHEALKVGFEMYVDAEPLRHSSGGYIGVLEELHQLSISRENSILVPLDMSDVKVSPTVFMNPFVVP